MSDYVTYMSSLLWARALWLVYFTSAIVHFVADRSFSTAANLFLEDVLVA